MKIFTKVCWFAGMLLLPSIMGCGGSSPSITNSPLLTPRTLSATLPDGLTATLAEDRSTVARGGTVTYTMTLTNPTAQPVTYQPFVGPGSSSYTVPASLVVTDPQGHIAFPTGPSSQVIFIGPNVTVAAGQSVSATQAVGSGSYSTTGQYNAAVVFNIIPVTPPGTQTATAVGPIGVAVQ